MVIVKMQMETIYLLSFPKYLHSERSLKMELVKEFLEEWRSTVCMIKEKALIGLGGIKKKSEEIEEVSQTRKKKKVGGKGTTITKDMIKREVEDVNVTESQENSAGINNDNSGNQPDGVKGSCDGQPESSKIQGEARVQGGSSIIKKQGESYKTKTEPELEDRDAKPFFTGGSVTFGDKEAAGIEPWKEDVLKPRSEEPDETLFGCESLVPSPIPIVKNKCIRLEMGNQGVSSDTKPEGPKEVIREEHKDPFVDEKASPRETEMNVNTHGVSPSIHSGTISGSKVPGSFGYKHGVGTNDSKISDICSGPHYGESKLRKPSVISYQKVDSKKDEALSSGPSRRISVERKNIEVSSISKGEDLKKEGIPSVKNDGISIDGIAKDPIGTKTGKKNAEANVKLNAALLQLKKRYFDKTNESLCIVENKSVAQPMQDIFQGSKEHEFKKPFFNTANLHQPTKACPSKTSQPFAKTADDYLYKQAIDNQLLKAASKNGVPQHIYKPKTKMPKLDEDNDTVVDSSFAVPDFAKDPAINFKVKMQDHGVLESYFSSGYDVDVEKLFPHIKNVSNASPNKWPARFDTS